jgi:hypothetical protein
VTQQSSRIRVIGSGAIGGSGVSRSLMSLAHLLEFRSSSPGIELACKNLSSKQLDFGVVSRIIIKLSANGKLSSLPHRSPVTAKYRSLHELL